MKSKFYGRLVVEHLESKWWRVIEGPRFYSAKYDITLYAPPRFVTDFASVPRLPLAYMMMGNTGHWEALMHDMLYRYGHPRLAADKIFYEAGRVRAKTRTKQGWLIDKGRAVRSGLMAGTTAAVGWAVYSPMPGCLDYRVKKTCGQNCISCDLFYPLWQQCIVDGCVPNLDEIHAEFKW
jgi:hypothetical protein